mgnify:CR=1 FL=1
MRVTNQITFTAKDESEAFRLASERLGRDAVILSTSVVKEGGVLGLFQRSVLKLYDLISINGICIACYVVFLLIIDLYLYLMQTLWTKSGFSGFLYMHAFLFALPQGSSSLPRR